MTIESHYKDATTNKNRRKKLKERFKRFIDNSEMAGNQKVFLKQNLMEMMQEYAELWECRPKKEIKS